MSSLALQCAPQLLLNIEPQKKSSYVLVDNDELVHFAWKMVARSKSIQLTHYGPPEALLADLAKYNESTVFFVDFDMGAELNGLDLARMIKRALGAKVILCTGHNPSDFEVELRIGTVDRVSGKEFIADEY